jgi:predicted aspartyl protease
VTAQSVPFRFVSNQILVEFTIAGRGPFVALVDTAAAPSVVDLALARELGLRVEDGSPGEAAGQGNEAAVFYPSELPSVRLGDVEVGNVEAVAPDLSRLGARLNEPLHAIFGQSFFEGRVVQLDYGSRQVRFDPHGFEGGMRADIEGAEDLSPVLTVQVNGTGVTVVLDTGSSLTLGVYTDSVETLGLGDALAAARPRESIGARGKIDAYEGKIDSIVVGDVHLSPVDAVFIPRGHDDPTGAQGNLGNGFLQHTVLTLDYPRRELYIRAATAERGRALGS